MKSIGLLKHTQRGAHGKTSSRWSRPGEDKTSAELGSLQGVGHMGSRNLPTIFRLLIVTGALALLLTVLVNRAAAQSSALAVSAGGGQPVASNLPDQKAPTDPPEQNDVPLSGAVVLIFIGIIIILLIEPGGYTHWHHHH
jgi:hypothetical protein